MTQEQPKPAEGRTPARSPIQQSPEVPFYEDTRASKPKSILSGGMGGVILNVVIALVVVFGFASVQGWVGQTQYRGDITRLENDLVAMRASVTAHNDQIAAAQTAANKAASDVTALRTTDTTLQTTLTTLQNQLAAKASTTELSNYVKASEIPALAKTGDLTAAQAQITELKTQIADLKAQVAALALNGTGATVTGQNGAITVTVDTLANLPMSVAGIPNATTVSSIFRVKLTNTSNKTLTNISLQASVVASGGLPTMAAGYPQLTGTVMPWVLAQNTGNILMFVNGWGMGNTGLSLGPGASTTIYPALTLQAAGAGAWNTTQYLFSPSVTVNSYDIQ